MQPNILTYNQVFKSNTLDFFSTLTNVEILHSDNNYLLFSGEETLHIKCKLNEKEYILVCFTDKNKNSENRYNSLSKIIENYNLSFIPKLEFKENEISINGTTSSVVLTDDQQSISLDTYFDNISFLPELVTKLQNDLKDLSTQLKAKQLAHGNLTFKTIRVNLKNELVLTFLDDLYIPEFETSNINKDSFINLHNKDLASFAMILSVLEIAKTDKTIQSNNVIFTFNSQDLNQIENTVAYSLIKSYENQAANNYLDFDPIVESDKKENQVTNDYNVEDYPIQNTDVTSESDEKVQSLIITSSPTGASIRDNEYDVFGKTPYTLEIKERDHPFQIIVTEKSNIKKIDIYYGMDDVFVDFNTVSTVGEMQKYEEVLSKNVDTTQRSIFWWYVGLLFVAMIGVIIYNSNDYSNSSVEDSSSVDSTAVVSDSTALVVDSAATPYYYNDSFVDSAAVVVDSAAAIADSSAYYYDGY